MTEEAPIQLQIEIFTDLYISLRRFTKTATFFYFFFILRTFHYLFSSMSIHITRSSNIYSYLFVFIRMIRRKKSIPNSELFIIKIKTHSRFKLKKIHLNPCAITLTRQLNIVPMMLTFK